MKRTLLLAIPSLVWMSAPGSARLVYADSHTCEFVETELIEVDGLLDDWGGIGKKTVGGNRRDASFSVRCAYDDQRLHVAVDVLDDYLYRGARPKPNKDDHMVVTLSAAGNKADRLLVYPGSDKVQPRRTWNGRKLPTWLKVEDTQKRHGWSMELSIPLARVRGYGKATPAVQTHIVYHDADFSAKVESKLAFAGRLELAAAVNAYRALLKSAKLSPKDIKLDRVVNVDDHKGPERVIAGRDVIGVISDQFFFMRLPVASPRDISKVEIADLRGDGTRSIITEYRQHGNGGSRDVVAIWQVSGYSLQQVFAFESKKQMNGKLLRNRWYLAPRGKFRKAKKSRRGHDLVIEVKDADASGWDEDNYFERPATDVAPILLPWSDQTSAVYYFEANTVQGGDPKSRR